MEIVKIGEIYSESIKDLVSMHKILFINTEIHAQGDLIMLKLRSEYEDKLNKEFNDFNIFEVEEFKKEFVKRMDPVYKKYEGQIKII